MNLTLSKLHYKEKLVLCFTDRRKRYQGGAQNPTQKHDGYIQNDKYEIKKGKGISNTILGRAKCFIN